MTRTQMAYVCIQSWLDQMVSNTQVYGARDESPWKEIFEHFDRARQTGFTAIPQQSGPAAEFAADSLTTDPARLEEALASVTLTLATHAACGDSGGYLLVAARDLQTLMDAVALWEKHRPKESPASMIEDPLPMALPAKIPKFNLIRKR
jgi:hypothetical protein